MWIPACALGLLFQEYPAQTSKGSWKSPTYVQPELRGGERLNPRQLLILRDHLKDFPNVKEAIVHHLY